MRFTVTAVLLLSLCSICPADTPSTGPLSIPDEASWLSYYSFRSSHPLLSRDTLNGVLSEGHRLRLEAASAALSAKISESPDDGFRSLDALIDSAAKDGLDIRAVFAPTLSALRSKLLEGNPEIAKSLESISERLDAASSPSTDSRSGYLAWLAARCGAEGETPDAESQVANGNMRTATSPALGRSRSDNPEIAQAADEYLKAFTDAPWDKGLLKFWGDLHYFSRRFDKAIEIYRRALAKGDSLSTDPRYSPFFEAEVRQRIGQCHLVCDRFDSAAVELERASTLASPPESAVSRLLAAHGLIRAKSPDAALPLLATAQRDAGGPGAPLPDAIVNSLKVQEALAWSAKGDPKKVLEILSGFERSPDPAFLLPSDRKMTWRLLGNAYLLTGDGESAEEMANKAESEPPLTTVQKADPMAERYGEFVDREAGAPAHIRFYLPDANSLMKNDVNRTQFPWTQNWGKYPEFKEG